MWPWMQLGALLTLTLGASLEGEKIASTVNHIRMESLPAWTVPNGQNLTLTCIVDISTTSPAQPQHTVLFYRDDEMIHNVSSTRDTESIFIPQARVHDSGMYRCSVILSNKEETTKEYMVTVKGVPSPKVMLDKTEATEGEEVAVTCAVEEERAPIHFTIEKVERNTSIVKQEKEKFSRHKNFVTLKFPIEEKDHAVFFNCQVWVLSVLDVEMSESIKSDMLTVREAFSAPRVQVRPRGQIVEGNQLLIRCTIQVKPWTSETLELILQKDKEIVAVGYRELIYSMTAQVEHSGNYTCKGQAGRISKVTRVEVKVEAKQTPEKISVTSSSGNSEHRDHE